MYGHIKVGFCVAESYFLGIPFIIFADFPQTILHDLFFWNVHEASATNVGDFMKCWDSMKTAVPSKIRREFSRVSAKKFLGPIFCFVALVIPLTMVVNPSQIVWA